MATDSATDPLLYAVLSFTSIGLVLNLGSILHKLARQYSIPKLWKYSYLTLDFAHVFLGIGLLLFVIFKFTGSAPVCDAASFLVQFALFDCVCAFLISGIILLGIYNPGKSTKLSTFHRNVFLVIFIPQKIISIFISALPFMSINYFKRNLTYSVSCLKIGRPSEGDGAIAILVFTILWISVALAIISCIISAIKLYKRFNNRIHSSSPNVWQTQLIGHGKCLLKILISEEVLWTVTLCEANIIIYADFLGVSHSTWIVYVTLSVVTVIHSVFSYIGDTMWGSCCCFSTREVEEPHRKLKKLELVKLEVSKLNI